jgi:hypothetical protein
MHVTLQLEGHLREFYPHLHEPLAIHLSQPAPVWEILKQAGVPPELPSTVLCGERRVERDYVPTDGETLILLSPMAGG